MWNKYLKIYFAFSSIAAEEYYENKKAIHPQDEQPAPLFQDPNQIQLQVENS